MVDPIRLALADEQATRRLGDDLAAMLRPGDLVFLQGDLGAGKSTLARAIIRNLANDPEHEVPSPTFTIVQPYETRHPLLQVDLYRLAAADEIDELGIAEALDTSIVLVEWAERAEGGLGEPDLTVALSGEGRFAGRFDHGPGRRHGPARPVAGRARLSRSLRLGRGAAPTPDRRRLGADLRDRAPARPTRTHPDERPAAARRTADPRRQAVQPHRPSGRIGDALRRHRPSATLARLLRAADRGRGARRRVSCSSNIWAARGVLDASGRPVPERYIAAAELLAKMHAQSWPNSAEAAPGMLHEIPPFDRPALHIETELLIDWYLPFARGRPADDAEQADFAEAWATVFDELETGEKRPDPARLSLAQF